MTKQERRLWYEVLSRYPVRFTKQKVIDEYIVDFYCNEAKLIVELDGSQHYAEEGILKDEVRDKRLKDLGFIILRISNYDVNTNLDGVSRYIHDTVCEILGRKIDDDEF